LSGQRIGYLRVSSVDQSTDRQLDSERNSLDRIFEDKMSGKDTERPALQEMLAYVREGDIIIVHSMDRLARSLRDLMNIMEVFENKGISVEFVKERMTFKPNSIDPMSTLTLSIMGAFAEFERAIIRERQREGIAIAKSKNVYKGRQKSFSEDDISRLTQLYKNGETITKIAKEMKAGRSTIYRYLKQIIVEEKKEKRNRLLSGADDA